MKTIVFAITALENGRPLGSAVACASARYASVLWRGEDRIDRRFAEARQWVAVEQSFADTIEPGPLPTDHAIVVALLPRTKRSGHVLQYLYAINVNDGPDAATDLDALLRSTIVPSLRQVQE